MNQSDRELLYQQLIMDRARAPLHAGVIEATQYAAHGNNPFCGDKTYVTVMLSPDGRIEKTKHQTRGCAICTASADLMAECIYGLEHAAIFSLFSKFDAMLQRETMSNSVYPANSELGVLRAFENLYEYRSRTRCATLPWSALFDALKNERVM